MINDIDTDYVKIDNDLASEIVTDKNIVKDIIISKQLEPDNDIGELDADFGIAPLISEARAALRGLRNNFTT